MGQNQLSTIPALRSFIASNSIQKRLEDTLGKRGAAFGVSIINVVAGSRQLQQCTHESIIGAAMKAAIINMPIDPALGQAAIVPYGKQAQFQIMHKGWIQLCIRSGQYAKIICTEIYQDELRRWNPISGEIEFQPVDLYKMRETAKVSDVIGHYCSFKLISGFEKADFMTHAQAMSHAKKYSKAYQYDLAQRKQTSAWSTDPVPMGNKTILLRLLPKYGVMSIEMQDALVAETSYEDASKEADTIIDGETGSEVVEKKTKTSVKKTKKKKVTSKASTTPPPEPETPEGDVWTCGDCDSVFDQPNTNREKENCCPECFSTEVTGPE